MPRIYLSPSTQEYNEFVNGGTEEYYMNLAMDAAVPYLNSSGILYTRNTPDMTAASSVAQANAGDYDLYIALHSNAAAPAMAGQVRGSLVFHYPTSASGIRAADIFVKNAKKIYPLPELVEAVPTTTLIEVARSRAPAVLWETAFHDNPEDAEWIKESIGSIGWTVAASALEFLGLPLAQPQPPRDAVVSITSGALNIRSYPSLSASVLVQLPRGAQLTVLGQVDDWYVVRYGSLTGYAATQYIAMVN